MHERLQKYQSYIFKSTIVTFHSVPSCLFPNIPKPLLLFSWLKQLAADAGEEFEANGMNKCETVDEIVCKASAGKHGTRTAAPFSSA